MRSPEQSCYLQHPYLQLQLHNNIASFTSCLCHYLQGCFCWAVLMKLPVLQFRLMPRKYPAGLSQPYKQFHLLISLLETVQCTSSSHPLSKPPASYLHTIIFFSGAALLSKSFPPRQTLRVSQDTKDAHFSFSLPQQANL